MDEAALLERALLIVELLTLELMALELTLLELCALEAVSLLDTEDKLLRAEDKLDNVATEELSDATLVATEDDEAICTLLEERVTPELSSPPPHAVIAAQPKVKIEILSVLFIF